MKIAIIGSRKIDHVDLEELVPKGATEIISGGAGGVDALAERYALAYGLPLTVFRPDYRRFRKGAPLKRNLQIVDEADEVIAVWDGESRGTKFTIRLRVSKEKAFAFKNCLPERVTTHTRGRVRLADEPRARLFSSKKACDERQGSIWPTSFTSTGCRYRWLRPK